MASSPLLPHSGQDRIIVAVDPKLLNLLKMAGRHPFDPQFLPAPAPVSHLSGGKRPLICFLIHICHHKHFIILTVLYYDRDQAIRPFFQIFP